MGEDRVQTLTRATFQELVAEADRPSILDFWGPQCAPCLALAPTFHDLAERYGDTMGFFRVEAPANRMLCVDLRVMSLPTFLAVVGGSESSRLDGEITEESLAEWVQSQQPQ
jgi:thioredoxin 1